MARILAIDYGLKRTGLAVTDPLKIIATGLCTIETHKLLKYIDEYLKKENVECIIVGMPKELDNTNTDATKSVIEFTKLLEKKYINIPIKLVDERYTSKMAFRAMIDGGLKMKQRRNKALIDKISAVIILQSFLEQQTHK